MPGAVLYRHQGTQNGTECSSSGLRCRNADAGGICLYSDAQLCYNDFMYIHTYILICSNVLCNESICISPPLYLCEERKGRRAQKLIKAIGLGAPAATLPPPHFPTFFGGGGGGGFTSKKNFIKKF